MNKTEFVAGMDRLLALKVESRLPTDKLIEAYAQTLAKMTAESWAYAVDLAMDTELTLPAPAWFLAIDRSHSEGSRRDAQSIDRQATQDQLDADFSPEQVLENIKRLRLLVEGVENNVE